MVRTSFIASLALSFVLSGCDNTVSDTSVDVGTGTDTASDTASDPGTATDPATDPGTDTDPGPAPEPFITCVDAPLPAAGANASWEHTATELMMLLHPDPDHSAQDVLVTDAVTAHIPGKFSYGSISKDLQDEWIEVWLDDCSGAYVHVGDALTDTDGRISVEVPSGLLPGFGRFATFLRVKGDQTFVTSELRMYPVSTSLIVTDIDGTLTISDSELFQDIFADLFQPLLGGTYVPEPRVDALPTMELRADQGYALVYLSGRPYWLTDITKGWLADLAFPAGTVHVIDGTAAAAPNNDAVGEFKRVYLQDLLAMGFILDGAYGNATTDIYAYGLAPVDPNRTWIAGTHGGEEGTVAIGEDYTAHYAIAAAEPDVVQPFELVP